MIDLVYRVLQTIINKEQSGYVSPDEFNNLAALIQLEIFRNYFEDYNRDQNKANRGLTNRGFGNLTANQRQMIEQFSEFTSLEVELPQDTNYAEVALPEDLYFLDDRGMLTKNGKVVDEVAKQSFGYVSNSISTFSNLYPVFSQFGNKLRIYPRGIQGPLTATYIRKPKAPKWTYRSVKGTPVFDPSNPSFQDFELHPSEFSNIVLKMLTHFGLNLREVEVMQIAEQLKNTITQKDNA